MHNDWLIEKKEVEGVLRDIPILVIDGNLEFENNVKRKNEILEQVSNFVAQTGMNPYQKAANFKEATIKFLSKRGALWIQNN